MKTIDPTMTLRAVIDQYPEAGGLFAAAGIGALVEGDNLDKVAPFLTLGSVLKSSGKDPETFIRNLNDQARAGRSAKDITLLQSRQGRWNAVGVIPMAVHLHMLEAFEEFRTGLEKGEGLEFRGRMASAQEGSDWIAQACGRVEDPRLLPDICLGRGFTFFFSPEFRTRFIETGVFQTPVPEEINQDFQGLGLPDPRGRYNVFAAIPAVIIVKERALGGLPVPRTWEELLEPRYRGTLAMPDCSADLPRAVLLTLYSRFGEEGVSRLAGNISKLLHPSQFAKKIRMPGNDVPAFSIMPHFFAQIVSSVPGIRVLWPQDGTIVEPLYILAKSKDEYCKADPRAVEAAREFFLGPKVASIFSRGHFPALHPGIHNGLDPQTPWWWVGWDFLEQNNVTGLAAGLERLFEETVAARACEGSRRCG